MIKKLLPVLAVLTLLAACGNDPSVYDGKVIDKRHASAGMFNPENFFLYVRGTDSQGKSHSYKVVTSLEEWTSIEQGDCVHIDLSASLRDGVKRIECK